MKYSNLKKKMKELNKWFHKYINGTKGVISIYLIICMLPTISINFLLTEGVRYQSALQMLEELIDSAGVSTLADYDKYLEERFGTMALDQETEIEENFTKYFDENVKLTGKSFTVDSKSVSGAYALANKDILKQQILEYSEVMAPAKFIYEVADIEELLDALEKKLPGKLGEIKDIADKTKKGADLASEIIGLVEKLNDVIEAYEKYALDYSEYKTSYNTFKTDILDCKDKVDQAAESENKVAEIQDELVEKRAELEQAREDEDEEKITKLEEEIKELEDDLDEAKDAKDTAETNESEAVRKVKSSRDTYKSNAGTLESSTQKLGDTISALQSKVNSISDGVLDVYDGSPDPNSTSTAPQSANHYIVEELEQLTHIIDTHLGSNYSDTVTDAVNELVDQQQALGNFQVSDINDSWTNETIKGLYGPVDLMVGDEFKSSIAKIVVVLAGSVDDEYKNEIMNLMDIVDIVQAILDLDVLYDLGLNAYVDSGNMHTDVAENGYAAILTVSLNTFLSAIDEFTTAVNNGDYDTDNKNILEKALDALKKICGVTLAYYKAMAKVLLAGATFLFAMVDILIEIVARVAGMFGAGWGELYNDLLLSVYGIYNFPCRTNYNKESTLTGYSFSKIFAEAGGDASRLSQIGGAISSMASTGSLTKDNPTFFGAEVEYLLAGTNSEVTNQASVFVVLYLIRFLVDIAPITANETLRPMIDSANAATLGVVGTIIQILIYIAEPFIDVIMLVNGGEIYLIKEQIYLAPDGITTLLSDFTRLLQVSTQASENLKTRITNLKKEWKEDTAKDPKGILKMDYREHAMVVMFLTVNQETLLKRMQNIMQAESAHHYRNKSGFDLDKAYTYIETDVQGQLNPMLPTDRLTENGLFTFSRKQYTGY